MQNGQPSEYSYNFLTKSIEPALSMPRGHHIYAMKPKPGAGPINS